MYQLYVNKDTKKFKCIPWLIVTFYSPFLCRLNSPQVATMARIILRLLKSNSIDRNPSSFKLRVVPTCLGGGEGRRKKKNEKKKKEKGKR